MVKVAMLVFRVPKLLVTPEAPTPLLLWLAVLLASKPTKAGACGPGTPIIAAVP